MSDRDVILVNRRYSNGGFISGKNFDSTGGSYTVGIDCLSSAKIKMTGKVSSRPISGARPVASSFLSENDSIEIEFTQSSDRFSVPEGSPSPGRNAIQKFSTPNDSIPEMIEFLRQCKESALFVTLYLNCGKFCDYVIESISSDLKGRSATVSVSLVKPRLVSNQYAKIPAELLAVPSKILGGKILCECPQGGTGEDVSGKPPSGISDNGKQPDDSADFDFIINDNGDVTDPAGNTVHIDPGSSLFYSLKEFVTQGGN